jgi:hypothetical protein
LGGLSFLDKKNVDSRAVFHPSQCRFLPTYSKIVLLIGEFNMKKLFFIILLFTIGLSAAEKKKLYVSKVIPQGSVPESISSTIVSRIKLALLEKYQKDYQIVSDEDISVMYKKAAELQKNSCDADSCLRQIAEMVDADEIIYGKVSASKNNTIQVSLTSLSRDKKTLRLETKGIVEESFPESQYSHYIRELTLKCMDKGYTINKSVAFQTEIQITPISFSKVEGVNLNKIDFKTDDALLKKFSGFFEKEIAEADALFSAGKYADARKEYEELLEKFNKEVPPSKKPLLKDVEPSLKKRIGLSVTMYYKTRVEAVDREVEKLSKEKD